MSPWKIGVYVGSGIIAVTSLVAIGFAVYRIFEQKKNPSRYGIEVESIKK